MLKQLLTNWKTTASGLTLIGGAVIHLVFAIKGHTADENAWTIAFGMVLGGIGLMFAGDSNVSATQAVKNAQAIDQINALGANPSAPSATEIVTKPVLVAPSVVTAAQAVAAASTPPKTP